MITTTSLLHPSMQIKIRSCRTQAMMGLVGKVKNRKGQVIMLCVKHGSFEDFQDPTFYAVYEDSNGVAHIGKDVTDMVTLACPYPVAQPKKSFFQRTKEKALSVYQNVVVNATGYASGVALVGLSFS